MTASTFKPASENFDNAPTGIFGATYTWNGFVYEATGSNGRVWIDSDWYGNSNNSILLQNYYSVNGTGTVSDVGFHSIDLADNFQLASMDLIQINGAFTIEGYNDGQRVVFDSVVPGQSDSAGSVTFKYANNANYGISQLTFSSAWNGIDTIKFVPTNLSSTNFYVILDNIELKTASIGLAAQSRPCSTAMVPCLRISISMSTTFSTRRCHRTPTATSA